MRRCPRPIVAAIALALAGTVAGCASFDPTDMLDFLDTKKKLPGDRRPVFPDGVPGIEQGIPKEYLQGQNTDPTAGPSLAGNPPAGGQSQTADGQTGDKPADQASAEAVKPPKNTKVASRRRITAIPKDNTAAPAPAAQTQQAAPAPAQQQSAFPAPLPNTFQPQPQQ